MPKFSKPIDRGFDFKCPFTGRMLCFKEWILKINIFKKKKVIDINE